MKTRLLTAAVVAFVIIAAINEQSFAGKYVEGIKWVANYGEGLKKAEEEKKNVFVLITAPTWCYYCKVFENTILIKEDVQKTINTKFVPVLVLDQIDGKRNPDLDRFSFQGFPSAFVYDKKGNMVKELHAQDAGSLVAELNNYSDAAKIEEDAKKVSKNLELTPKAKEELDNFMNQWIKK